MWSIGWVLSSHPVELGAQAGALGKVSGSGLVAPQANFLG